MSTVRDERRHFEAEERRRQDDLADPPEALTRDGHAPTPAPDVYGANLHRAFESVRKRREAGRLAEVVVARVRCRPCRRESLARQSLAVVYRTDEGPLFHAERKEVGITASLLIQDDQERARVTALLAEAGGDPATVARLLAEDPEEQAEVEARLRAQFGAGPLVLQPRRHMLDAWSDVLVLVCPELPAVPRYSPTGRVPLTAR